MKRRGFFKKSTGIAAVIGLSPLAVNAENNKEKIGERKKDKWYQVGTGKTGVPERNKTLDYDVVVVGGGLSGIGAAVTAARTGAKTVLVQDRPVLGGNASSEIRVTVNGAQVLKNKHRVERETGVIEEFQIENLYYNPQQSYPIWDHVLYDYVTRQENLELMVNTQAIDAEMKGGKIKSAICWQSTTETTLTLKAKMFIDCSGDGLLGAMAGAEYRTGREGQDEFGEKFAPEKADGWQMGASLIMTTKDMGKPTPYYPPSFALEYKADTMHPKRKFRQFKEGYWWIEIGSDYDIIADQEENRHKLMGYLHGVWDHIKNSGLYPEADNLALDWVGSVAGRRESRRFMGDHILTEGDMLGYKHFPDAVAYGGWSLDEHCPGGIENPSDPPSYFHSRFTKMYEVPFRCLYSKNIPNLLFAGRNVSVSHIALSSTRIMATCALMGQAVGTASAMCVKNGWTPRELANNHIDELQERLLRDDSFIPNRPARDKDDLARKASAIMASSTKSGDVNLLTDGVSRDELDKIHHWKSDGLNAEVQMEWEKPINLSCIEIKCDSNLQRTIMMHKNPDITAKHKQVLAVPPEILKDLTAEVRVNGKWKEVAKVEGNIYRLIKMNFENVKTTAVRLKLKETWGEKDVKLFELRCYA